MKKYLLSLAILFILSACTSAATETPTTSQPEPVPTLTNVPVTEAVPSATVEAVVPTIQPTETPSTYRVSPVNGMPQVYIPKGTLHMGGFDVRAAPDEFPAHDVEVDAFWMDQLEVTNAMYQLCVGVGVCLPPQSIHSNRRTEYYGLTEFNDYPVVYVTWGQAKTYCEWAGERLPTEAEWERAARGDDMRTFPWGEDKADDRYANFNMLVTDTSRVGSYPLGTSPFGVLDMAGNVAEWVNDFYGPTYYESADNTINPTGPAVSSSLRRVVRGGSLGDAEINIRVSKRSAVLGSDLSKLKDSKEFLGDFSARIGFRCVVGN